MNDTLRHPPRIGEEQLDGALVRVHRTSPVWREELANHAPMAAEALVALGRADAIDAFLDVYEKNLEPAETALPTLLPAYQQHLGDRSHLTSFCAHFEARIAEDGVDNVVGKALPLLFPGVLAGALHGLLRVSHALRAWRHVDNAGRRREVAQGLGYWAASYRVLDGAPGSQAAPGRDAVVALKELSSLPPEFAVDGITITTRAEASVRYPTFLEEITRVDLNVWDVHRTISELCGLGASLLIASTHPSVRFCYLHAITGTSALRNLLPWLDDEGRRTALAHHWHALAAIHCMNSGMHKTVSQQAPPIPARNYGDTAELIAQAVASHDDHAIKLTATAIAETEHHPDPRFLEAAWCYVAAAT